ncbi:MAG: sensor histidine kinase [Flavobacteriales bacterium]
MRIIPLLLAMSFGLSASYANNDSIILTTQARLDTAKSAGSRIQIMLDIIDRLEFSDPETAIGWADQIIELSEKNKDRKGLAVGYGSKSRILSYLGDFENAITLGNKAADIEKEIGRLDKYAGALANIGVYYEDLGQPDEAMKLYMEVKQLIDDGLNDSNLLANLSNNIASLNQGKCRSMMDTSFCWECIAQYRIVLSIDEIHEDLANSARTLNNIGNSFNDMFLITEDKTLADSALKYFRKSAALRGQFNDLMGYVNVYSNMGLTFAVLNQRDSSTKYRELALEAAEKSKYAPAIIHALQGLADEKYDLGEYKTAAELGVRVHLMSDSMLSSEMTKQIAEAQAKFDVERKAKENADLKAEKAEARSQRNMVIGGALLLLLLVGSGFVVVRQRQKVTREAELNQQQKLRFKAVIEAEEKERTRIAKELHDGLGQLLSVIKMTITKINPTAEEDKERIVTAKDLVDETVKEVRSISHNMMPYVLMEEGIHKAVDQLVEKINDVGLIQVHLTNSIREKVLESTTSIAIYRIIQEVLNNMIKHSQAKNIFVKLESKGDSIHLVMNDDGVGFDTSEIEKSEGIGWKNIISRVMTLDGRIDVDSERGKGTSVNIDLVV